MELLKSSSWGSSKFAAEKMKELDTKELIEETEEREDLSLEESFALLDELAEQLENRDISLEDSLRLYKQGMELLKSCSEKIDTVEKKMLQVNDNGEFFDF